MTVITYQVNTIRKRVELPEDLRKCSCGGNMIAEDHFRKRKPKELYGTASWCDNPECEYHKEGFLGYDQDDLIRKMRKVG